MISYVFEDTRIIDGQHCHDKPTQQTNFGIVSTIKLPKNVDGTRFGVSYIKTFNEFTGHKPALQILDDFIKRRVTIEERLRNSCVNPTMSDYSLIDFNLILSFDLRRKILKFIKKINKIYPQSISKESLIYGPVLERFFPKVETDFNMESSVKGFYIVGDISGKAIGVITGAAAGLKAASHILQVK